MGALTLFLIWQARRQHAEARQVTAELREVRSRLGLPAQEREDEHE
ncbi:hypothetical protein ACFSC4_21410 [Deinococcus malanensis]|nr:hypothetical protein [Deinococcus malanensis]